MDGFIRGFNELCGKYGVALLGGDTSASDDKLFINVTLLGECPHGRAILRSGARAGDIIYVTGPLGDAAAGLKLILERVAKEGSSTASTTLGQTLIRRHYLPEPRVEMGMALAALPGVHSMMDISDGIASDLKHILEASGGPASLAGGTIPLRPSSLRCGRVTQDGSPSRAAQGPLAAEIDLQSLPLSDDLRTVSAERGWDPFELAVSGGEDYELLFTAAPDCKVPDGCVAIGRIVDSRSEPGMTGQIRWIGSDKEYKGFTHF